MPLFVSVLIKRNGGKEMIEVRDRLVTVTGKGIVKGETMIACSAVF